ncbi:coiled-coil alpha-helical rod protein 1 isoform X2 [Boleophthalmus pectinirostris]|uniref:coiled-coil alpha-helical rod protein 1 isoform X2 n=1 Tax=Boleophthalmus pectinirostris TaxID=150288 RepID=UPI002432C807|nr:coiled-coil alpha-helical rod protein 1 isoform X2 [Boleophthalmus pectinirostris]
MEIPSLGKERLIVPTDFTKSKVQDNLVPPSHFASTVSSAGVQISATGGKMPVTAPPINWTKPSLASLPSTDHSHSSYWLVMSQTQQEILELKKENQRLMLLQNENLSRNKVRDYNPRPVERSEQWASQWRLESENYKAETERLKGQVQTLKEAAVTHRAEIRDKDITLNRQAHELEMVCEELQKIKAELGLVREELSQAIIEKEQIRTQSSEEIQMLNRDLEISREEAKDLSLKADQCRLQAEEAIKQQTQRLSKQLEELQKNQETKIQKLTASHSAELQKTVRENRELHDRLQIMSSEVLQLKGRLTEVSAEKNGLKDHLSQMRQAFETQSATLHSLRNYIGQLTPESGERDRLNEALERLNKEKAALQTTAELLTIRLNSVNEILTLQEEKLIKKNTTESFVKNGSEALHVLQLWREKVFKLCVQLRTKDIELRGEKYELLSQVNAIAQQLQQEQHQTSVLRHSLEDKTAALDLERVQKETLKQHLAQTQKENSQLKLQMDKDQKDLKYLSEAVQRFSFVFKEKVLEVDAAQTKLNMCAQRLTFAKRRVETIQGLIMRRAALQKVQQSTKQVEQAADCIRSLQTELQMVSEERDRLTLELKRTPELIEKALSDLKEQYEGKLMQKQQDLDQSIVNIQEAVSERNQAQRREELIQEQLHQTEVKLERLSCELLSQQESSQRALEERVSEIEECCAAKLKEMEDQVNRARAEHTRAVMTLRHFERQATKKKEHLQRDHAQSEPGVSVLINHTAIQPGPALWEQRKTISQTPTLRPKVQLPADAQLLSVLEELQSLSAAVVNSSEDSAAEEEGPVAQDNNMKGSHRDGRHGDAEEE